MPTADKQTWLRTPTDIDWLEEKAWTIVENNGWVATPQLLFALKDLLNDEILKHAATEADSQD